MSGLDLINRYFHEQRERMERLREESINRAYTPETSVEREGVVDEIYTIGGLKIVFTYEQDPGNPALPGPNDNVSDTPNIHQRLFDISQKTQFMETLDNTFDQVTQQYNLTESQINQLLTAYLLDMPPDDTFLADIYKEIDAMVSGEMVAEFPELGEEWKPTGLKKSYKERITSNYHGTFEELLSKKGLEALAKKLGIPVEVLKQKIRVAHYLPDQADPDVKEIVNQLEVSAMKELGIPEQFRADKVDNTSFLAEMTVNYDEAFENALSEYAKANNLSSETINQLKYLHNFPDANYPNKEILLGHLSKVNDSFLAEFLVQNGLPTDFVPETATATYNARINGHYRFLFEQNLYSQVPPLTDAQITAIWKALENPNDPKITEETKALIANLKEKTLGQVIQERALPSDWQPGIELRPMGLTARTAFRAINTAEEMLGILTLMVDDMPDSPERVMLINILKMVSEALAEMKQLLYLLQSLDTDIARNMSKLELETILLKYDKEGKTLDEIREKTEEKQSKEAKQKAMSLTMKILGPILMVLAVAGSILTGGISGFLVAAIMVLMLADSVYSEASGKEPLMMQGFDELNKTLMAELSPELAMTINAVIVVAVVIAISVLSANPSIGAMIFAQSGLVADIAVSSGASEETAAIIDAAVNCVVAICGGIASFKLAGKTIAKQASKSIERTLKATKGFKHLRSFVKSGHFRKTVAGGYVAQAGIQVTDSGYRIHTSKIMVDITLMRGDLDEFLANVQEMIKLLRQLVSKLLSGVEDNAEWGSQINDVIEKIFKGMSDTGTAITRAAQA